MRRHPTQAVITFHGYGKWEHATAALVVGNADWPDGEGEYLISCPGCPACDPDVLAEWRLDAPAASDADLLAAWLAAKRLGAT